MKNKDFNFDFKQIHSFVETVNENSFTKASRKLKIGQATISHHIAGLEDTFGVTLFNRKGKDLSLTQEGLIFKKFCDKFSAEINSIQNDFQKEKTDGKIIIASSTIPSTYILPEAIAFVKKINLGYYYKIIISDSREAVESVKEGTAEIGIVGKNLKHKLLSYIKISSDEIVLIGPADFPDKIKINDLHKIKFISRENGSGTRTAYENNLSSKGITHSKMNIVFESSTSEGVKESVIAGIGVSFISSLAIKREVSLKKLKIIKIDDFSITRDFYAVYQKNRTLSNPAKALLEKLKVISSS